MAITKPREAMKRGELGRRSGCNIETIRYYERIGLLPEPDRTDSGHRLYSPEDQAQLGFVMRGRELGFSVAEIRALLSLMNSSEFTCGEVLDMASSHLASIKAKIRDLRKLEKSLTRLVRNCEGGEAKDCPVIDALAGDRPA